MILRLKIRKKIAHFRASFDSLHRRINRIGIDDRLQFRYQIGWNRSVMDHIDSRDENPYGTTVGCDLQCVSKIVGTNLRCSSIPTPSVGKKIRFV